MDDGIIIAKYLLTTENFILFVNMINRYLLKYDDIFLVIRWERFRDATMSICLRNYQNLCYSSILSQVNENFADHEHD